MKVIFLDYDGVVNTPMWKKYGETFRCCFGFPGDNKVNNWEAVQWVSEFCEKYGYSIVVSSTWRIDDNYAECLINGGLRNGIEILGRTPVLHDGTRGDEISAWLSNHPEVDGYLIFDDENDVANHITRLVKCDTGHGFGEREFNLAVTLDGALNK